MAKATAPQSDGQRSFTDGAPHVTNGGRLRDSLQIGFATQRGKKVIRIFSDARNSRGRFYIRDVVKGTRPHLIRARSGRGLRFFWINKEKSMKIQQVMHPGTRPNNFLLEALRRGFRR